MRRVFALSLLATAAAVPAAAGDFHVTVNEARPFPAPDGWHALVVGNPLIADVTPHSDRTLLVTGKAFGATNILALDIDGKILAAVDVTVAPPATGRVLVQRGPLVRQTYHCASECMPAPAIGDDSNFASDVNEVRDAGFAAARSAADAR